MRCYCSICRKSAGSGGYAINIMGEADSLSVDGEAAVAVWQARIDHGRGPEESPARRHFCVRCGSALWLSDPRWPEWVYPQAGAIDSPLPTPPDITHIMLDSKPDWVAIAPADGDLCFAGYPEASIEQWHRDRDLYEDE